MSFMSCGNNLSGRESPDNKDSVEEIEVVDHLAKRCPDVTYPA